MRSQYAPRQSHAHATFDKSMSSTAGDFRLLTPLVLMTALRRAGTAVCEPMHRLRLEAPPDTFGAVMSALSALDAVPRWRPAAPSWTADPGRAGARAAAATPVAHPG